MSATSIDTRPVQLPATSIPGGPPGPARVLLADVEALADVDCTHPQGGLYSTVWVLALRRGAPLGIVEIEVSSPTIAADELEARLRQGLGQMWDLEVAEESDAIALPRASVVVATNVTRPEELLACVARLSELDYPDYEVLVVENRRTTARGDDVLEDLRGLPRVRVLAERRPGTSAARNRGLAAASGEIVAFTDDDVEVDRRWLRALAGRLVEEPGVDAVSGLVVPKELETPAQIWFEQSGSGVDRVYTRLSFELAARGRHAGGVLSGARFRVLRKRAPDSRVSAVSLYAVGEFGIGSNMAVRRDVLGELGGFDETLGPGTPAKAAEDLALLLELLSAGRGIAYEPRALVHHVNRRTVEELERQISGYGVGFTAMLVGLIWRDPRHLFGLIAMTPRALRSTFSRSSIKQSRRPDSYPPQLSRAELRGMLAGPLAYVRSRRAQRRWSR